MSIRRRRFKSTRERWLLSLSINYSSLKKIWKNYYHSFIRQMKICYEQCYVDNAQQQKQNPYQFYSQTFTAALGVYFFFHDRLRELVPPIPSFACVADALNLLTIQMV